jgi:glyceraldehyde-3-phosphate dehydrogenase (NAD(P))
MSEKVRVAVNGYGVIGKRVADAVRMQPDMELVGVSDVVSDYRIKTAVTLGIPVYASVGEKSMEMVEAGVSVTGGMPALLHGVDVIVDCTPAGIGAANPDQYREHGSKSFSKAARSTPSPVILSWLMPTTRLR